MATEQEQDFESGDPTGQGRGTLTDDEDPDKFEMDDMDEEEPFTDFRQFEQYETSTELLTAIQTAAEHARKHAEDRAKAGGRKPHSLPNPDVYMMGPGLFRGAVRSSGGTCP